MSGGSFNYLCYADLRQGDLEAMARELDALPDGQQAAARTRRIIQLRDELSDVWRAVEWWCSGDYGEGQVAEELAKLNAKLNEGER